MSSTPCSKNNVIAPAMPVLFRNSLSHRSQNSHMAIKKAQSVTNILQDDLSNNNNNTQTHTHTHTHRNTNNTHTHTTLHPPPTHTHRHKALRNKHHAFLILLLEVTDRLYSTIEEN